MRMAGMTSHLVRRLVPCRLARLWSSGPPSHWTHHLTSRGVLRVRGPDTASFLQGLITNDMRHFDDGARAIYAMMLNTKGRVLFDLIVYRHDDDGGFLLEVDRSLASALQSLLKIYRVRRKIDIDNVSEQTAVVAVRATEEPGAAAPAGPADCTEHGAAAHATAPLGLGLAAGDGVLAASRDPRLPALGWRLVVDAFADVGRLLPGSAPDGEPRPLRCRLGVAEGAAEVPHAACTPLEYNADYLHGVSFHKGCYVGQELTARTHHTGVVRKRVMPLRFERPEEAAVGAAVLGPAGGRPLGKVLAVCGRDGLGLLRVAESLAAERLVLEGGRRDVATHRPAWWPAVAASEARTKAA